jgi:60 kDa SS-A/Ro ribonucleoprotein
MASKTYVTSTRATPQSQPIPGKANQVQNSAGGFVFSLSDWDRLDRFLILGSEGGTYYVGEKQLTADNAQAVTRCIAADGVRAVAQIVAVSDAGRAPKNDPALFALALAASLGDEATRKAAFEALPKVARIGTHLFHFLEYCKGHRGWGRAMRQAVADWYNRKAPKDLAFGAIKYQSRDGWSNRDALRKSHPIPATETHKTVYGWMTKGWPEVGSDPHPDEALRIIWAFERAKLAKTAKEIVNLITTYNLPREAIPTEWLNDATVWAALLPGMPVAATIRNLGKMTAVGLLKPMSAATATVTARITDPEQLRKSREHPLAILVAMKIYAQGHGDKGSLEWQPVREIVDALDKAFYLSFGNVPATGKRYMLALDVSGSMGNATIAGMPLTAREASAAMAMVTANVESQYMVIGFTGNDSVTNLDISPRQRMDDIVRKISGLQFGNTDCALPMLLATQEKLGIDTFIIYTDNETWQGRIHASQALEQYRRQSGINAKLIVVGMTSTGFSIGDPDDPGTLNVVGFDTAAPGVIADFCK